MSARTSAPLVGLSANLASFVRRLLGVQAHGMRSLLGEKVLSLYTGWHTHERFENNADLGVPPPDITGRALKIGPVMLTTPVDTVSRLTTGPAVASVGHTTGTILGTCWMSPTTRPNAFRL